MKFLSNHNSSKRLLISITFCVLILLLVSGCRPNVKQKSEMEDAKMRAANAIQGAKSAIASAESAIQKAKSIAQKVKSASLNDTWSDVMNKATGLLGQAQGKMIEGTDAHKKATSGNVSKVIAIYAESERLAQESTKNARLAASRADKEYRRLQDILKREKAEEKERKRKAAHLKQLEDEVKKYQGLLEKAIQGGDPFEIARLMIKLAEAELNLEKERLNQDLTDKAAVNKAEKRLADLKDLENRLKQAKASMEAARRQYEDAKAKREGLEIKIEKLKADVAEIRAEVEEASRTKSGIEEEIKEKQ